VSVVSVVSGDTRIEVNAPSPQGPAGVQH